MPSRSVTCFRDLIREISSTCKFCPDAEKTFSPSEFYSFSDFIFVFSYFIHV